MKISEVRAYPGSGLRKQDQGWQNAVERNRTKARSADCGFAEPEPTDQGGEAVTVCYVKLHFAFTKYAK